MMRFGFFSSILLCMALLLTGCGSHTAPKREQDVPANTEAFTRQSKIEDVVRDPAFGSFGRLLFPIDESYYSGDTLEELQLVYYSHIDPDETVEIVNTLKQRAQAGRTIFYDIYTDEEKAADPARRTPGCSSSRERRERGSLSATQAEPSPMWVPCRIASPTRWSFPGRATTPSRSFTAPGAVVMQYTGLNEYSELDPPTYACVGDRDGIANWRVMQARLEAMQQAGIDTEFHVYPGLGYGFGLGTGTSAEGWLNDAAAFWEKQMDA